VNKEPSRRPTADGPNPSDEAAPTGPLDDSPKGTPEVHAGDLEPRYTVDNLEAWADVARHLVDNPRDHDLDPRQAEALTMAARFLTDTAAVLRRQREDRARRAARSVIESRQQRRAQRRRRGR
jgi:hypothetical protein